MHEPNDDRAEARLQTQVKAFIRMQEQNGAPAMLIAKTLACAAVGMLVGISGLSNARSYFMQLLAALDDPRQSMH